MKKIMLTVAAALSLASYAADEAKLPVWANNNLGMEAVGKDYIDPDHAPLQLDGDTITAGFKSLTLDKFGLPKAVKVKGLDVLKYPVRLEFEDDRMQLRLRPDQFTVKKDGKNSVFSTAEFTSAGVKFKITAQFDFDFTIRYKIEISPEKGAIAAVINWTYCGNGQREQLAAVPNEPEIKAVCGRTKYSYTLEMAIPRTLLRLNNRGCARLGILYWDSRLQDYRTPLPLPYHGHDIYNRIHLRLPAR